ARQGHSHAEPQSERGRCLSLAAQDCDGSQDAPGGSGARGLGRRGVAAVTRLRIGFIPLTDCAVLAVAMEKGFFRRHGVEVTLSREASWASIRDKVALGALDAAQMLAGMPLAAAVGSDPIGRALVT